MSERRPRTDARRNHTRLLATAHEVFSEHGTGASLEEVARRAGVGIGTLYRHFPTRDALLEELLRDRYEGLRVEAERLAGAHPPPVALARWLRALVARTSTYRGLPASVVTSMRSEGSELYASCHAMRDAGLDLIAKARAAGAIGDAVEPDDILALAGAIAWVGERLPDDPGKPERLLALVMTALNLSP